MPLPLSCSIIIPSFNKAGFTCFAVESALSQTYQHVEVIVVDDGSTDQSVELLRGFGDRIRLVAKLNGGQASAMNAGYALSSGDIVFFLDCDDVLDPDVVQRVVDTWTADTAKVHFRLRKILEDGSSVAGGFVPPYRELPAGDILPLFEKFGFYPAPPTTGNAFARRVLEGLLPLSEQIYRAWPDTPLVGAAPMFGKVVAIGGVGGSHRLTTNNYSKGGLGKVEAKLACEQAYLDMLQSKFADRLPAGFRLRWPLHLKDRLLLAKFSRSSARRPESPFRLAMAYGGSVLQWPEYSWLRRVCLLLWAFAVALLPHHLLRQVPKIAGPNLEL